MTKPDGRGAGRPGGEHPLTRTAVMQAALGLVDREGADNLSLRHLGAALGVEGMTIHYHAGGKDGLLDGVVEAVMDELRPPPLVPGASWLDRLREFAFAYRATLMQHPRALPIVASRPWKARDHRVIESLLAMLRRGGLGPARSWHIANALCAFVIGHVLIEAGDLAMTDEVSGGKVSSSLKNLTPAEFPALVSTIALLDMQRIDFDAVYAVGLDAFLQGLISRDVEEEA